jgi:hypothetical protein
VGEAGVPEAGTRGLLLTGKGAVKQGRFSWGEVACAELEFSVRHVGAFDGGSRRSYEICSCATTD